ncbi:serine/threonine-protein kinase [Streptomyces sp. NPDC089799]|uniref:serine/threonine-protein kinase n=1 Tax=Streptomyces sp. NPDC089799 TaxID=3155066 RepID=UPI003446EBCD
MAPNDLFPRGLGRRYEPLRVIGRGGMGVVFAAEDLRLERMVAVKVLTRQEGLGEKAAQRFRDEAIALARISHPCVVAVHDAGMDDSVPYLVMELLDGEDLADLVAGHGPLSVDRACRVAVDMLTGLGAAHASGVLHRDVKPQNVRITRRGVVLYDFGLAKLADDSSDTAGGGIVGTPDYLAPERVQGSRASPASDLYGVGVCLRFMLTGRRPVEAEDDHPIATVYRIARGLPSLRETGLSLPEGFADVVDSLCALAPRDRPADTGEAVRLLSPWAAEPGTVPEAPFVPRQADPDPEWRPPHGDLSRTVEPVPLGAVTRRLVRSRMTEPSALARQREAVALVLRGDVREAADILDGVLPYCRENLGAAHPTTLACQYWQAVCLSRLGESAAAVELFAQISNRIGAARSEKHA